MTYQEPIYACYSCSIDVAYGAIQDERGTLQLSGTLADALNDPDAHVSHGRCSFCGDMGLVHDVEHPEK